ncbi:conserved domain protein, partial [Ruminococcus albus 8]
MEASERINIILKKLDIDATTLKKNLVKYLVQIEEVLEQKRIRRRELLKELTESDYTVKNIAQET